MLPIFITKNVKGWFLLNFIINWIYLLNSNDYFWDQFFWDKVNWLFYHVQIIFLKYSRFCAFEYYTRGILSKIFFCHTFINRIFTSCFFSSYAISILLMCKVYFTCIYFIFVFVESLWICPLVLAANLCFNFLFIYG